MVEGKKLDGEDDPYYTPATKESEIYAQLHQQGIKMIRDKDIQSVYLQLATTELATFSVSNLLCTHMQTNRFTWRRSLWDGKQGHLEERVWVHYRSGRQNNENER